MKPKDVQILFPNTFIIWHLILNKIKIDYSDILYACIRQHIHDQYSIVNFNNQLRTRYIKKPYCQSIYFHIFSFNSKYKYLISIFFYRKSNVKKMPMLNYHKISRNYEFHVNLHNFEVMTVRIFFLVVLKYVCTIAH